MSSTETTTQPEINSKTLRFAGEALMRIIREAVDHNPRLQDEDAKGALQAQYTRLENSLGPADDPDPQKIQGAFEAVKAFMLTVEAKYDKVFTATSGGQEPLFRMPPRLTDSFEDFVYFESLIEENEELTSSIYSARDAIIMGEMQRAELASVFRDIIHNQIIEFLYQAGIGIEIKTAGQARLSVRAAIAAYGMKKFYDLLAMEDMDLEDLTEDVEGVPDHNETTPQATTLRLITAEGDGASASNAASILNSLPPSIDALPLEAALAEIIIEARNRIEAQQTDGAPSQRFRTIEAARLKGQTLSVVR